MKKFIGAALLSLGVIVVVIGVSIFSSLPTMWSWNYVMPYLFGLKEITFWHALSLNILAGMLIKATLSSKK